MDIKFLNRIAGQLHKLKKEAFNNQTLQSELLDVNLIKQIRDIQKDIPKDILDSSNDEEGWIKDGIQELLHITILYGIKNEHKDKAIEVCKKYMDKGIEVKTSGLEYFDNEKDKDDGISRTACVVKLISPKLSELHYELAKELGVVDTYPEYKPHVCVAYLKFKERLKSTIDEMSFNIDNIQMSTLDGYLEELL